MGLFQYFCHGFFLFHLITFAPLIPCQFPNCFSLALLWCSPQALQEAAVSSESPETQEEREKAWRRGGRQPEKLGYVSLDFSFCFLLLLQFQMFRLTMVGELFQMFCLTMVGELFQMFCPHHGGGVSRPTPRDRQGTHRAAISGQTPGEARDCVYFKLVLWT